MCFFLTLFTGRILIGVGTFIASPLYLYIICCPKFQSGNNILFSGIPVPFSGYLCPGRDLFDIRPSNCFGLLLIFAGIHFCRFRNFRVLRSFDRMLIGQMYGCDRTVFLYKRAFCVQCDLETCFFRRTLIIFQRNLHLLKGNALRKYNLFGYRLIIGAGDGTVRTCSHDHTCDLIISGNTVDQNRSRSFRAIYRDLFGIHRKNRFFFFIVIRNIQISRRSTGKCASGYIAQ